MIMVDKRIQNVVRLAQTDLDGDKVLGEALRSIKGISHRLAKNICRISSLDSNRVLSELSDEEKSNLEEVIENPKEHGIPTWMLNRRNDPREGSDLHLTGSKLDFAQMEDINRLKKIKAYKGVRHTKGLPVRGQKTRTSFRGGKSVGVSRKRVQKEEAE